MRADTNVQLISGKSRLGAECVLAGRTVNYAHAYCAVTAHFLSHRQHLCVISFPPTACTWD